MTDSGVAYYKQKRRLHWAQLRCLALTLRGGRRRWEDRDRFAPERILRVLESDLLQAEEAWKSTWDELDWMRECHQIAKNKQAARDDA